MLNFLFFQELLFGFFFLHRVWVVVFGLGSRADDDFNFKINYVSTDKLSSKLSFIYLFI